MWPLVVLTGWPHKRGFIIRKCMGVSPDEVAVRRGCTVDIKVTLRCYMAVIKN